MQAYSFSPRRILFARRGWFLSALTLTACWLAPISIAADVAKLPPAASRAVDFTKEIEPLLAERCYQCHGSKRSESALRLDSGEAALRGGDHGPVLVPGKSAESLIVQVLSGTHKELARMPKKGDPFRT